MTPTPTLADEIEALAKEATPGRWGATPAVPGAQRYFYLVGNRDDNNREVDIGSIQGGYYSCAANAALIVALVNNAPAIVSALREVSALKEEVERLREVSDEWTEQAAARMHDHLNPSGPPWPIFTELDPQMANRIRGLARAALGGGG